MRELTGCLVAIGGIERATAQVARATRQLAIEEALHCPWMIGHAREKTADEAVREIAVANSGFGRFI